MEASILDLRYRMREVLKALSRREKISILYHGKVKGELIPAGSTGIKKSSSHAMFGMLRKEKENPADIVSDLRRSRHRDI